MAKEFAMPPPVDLENVLGTSNTTKRSRSTGPKSARKVALRADKKVRLFKMRAMQIVHLRPQMVELDKKIEKCIADKQKLEQMLAYLRFEKSKLEMQSI